MLLATKAGVVPTHLTRGASIALDLLCKEKDRKDRSALLDELWEEGEEDQRREFKELILQ